MSAPRSARPQFFRGEIWEADLNPTRGREQAGLRPVLIVSDDRFNLGPLDMAIVASLTSTLRSWPTRVLVTPPEGGLRIASEIQCDQLRTIDITRLLRPYGAAVAPATMERVAAILRILLNL